MDHGFDRYQTSLNYNSDDENVPLTSRPTTSATPPLTHTRPIHPYTSPVSRYGSSLSLYGQQQPTPLLAFRARQVASQTDSPVTISTIDFGLQTDVLSVEEVDNLIVNVDIITQDLLVIKQSLTTLITTCDQLDNITHQLNKLTSTNRQVRFSNHDLKQTFPSDSQIRSTTTTVCQLETNIHCYLCPLYVMCAIIIVFNILTMALSLTA